MFGLGSATIGGIQAGDVAAVADLGADQISFKLGVRVPGQNGSPTGSGDSFEDLIGDVASAQIGLSFTSDPASGITELLVTGNVSALGGAIDTALDGVLVIQPNGMFGAARLGVEIGSQGDAFYLDGLGYLSFNTVRDTDGDLIPEDLRDLFPELAEGDQEHADLALLTDNFRFLTQVDVGILDIFEGFRVPLDRGQ